MLGSIHNSRPLLSLFLATTVLPLACLAWLAWRVVAEDRQSQQARAIEQREQAADLAASALQRVLAEANEQLANSTAAASGFSTAPDGMALVSFQRATLLRRAGTPLPFYPALHPENAQLHVNTARFAQADALELQKNDLPTALAAVGRFAKNADPVVRGEALLRIARIERKLGDSVRAVDALDALGGLDQVSIVGEPAGLIARQGRALLFDASSRRGELGQEATGLCDDLANGRWLLSREQFEIGFAQAQSWVRKADSSARCNIESERLAMADTVDSAWREWQALGDRAPNGARTVKADGTSVLLLSRSTPDRDAMLLMPPSSLRATWFAMLRTSAIGQGFDFALSDSDGRPVLDKIDSPVSIQSVRAPDTTQLPWTIHVISKRKEAQRGLSGQTKLVLVGIFIMAAVALCAGWLINRALLRELRVACVQSDFVAAVSHEFRTPLTTIRQLAEMLASGRISNDDRRRQFYSMLLAESERLHRLVEGLLNFGRMEAGQIRYRFEVIEPEQFVRSVVSDFEREATGRGYRIELQGNGALPPIRADRESLARVFWNLLDNAVKYSPDTRTVKVGLARVGRRVAVSVRDRGIGIPTAEQKTIFQKFVRGAASKEANIQGAGVGLSMARQIVAAHGGEISLESGPGEGSIFTVLLPLAES